jgi:hypothetical protein
MFRDRPYPMASPLEPNADRYPASTEPAEKSLKLEEPLLPRRDNGKPVAPMPGQGRVGGASR